MSAPQLLDREPVVIVRDLLITQWDPTNIDGTFDAAAWIHTGWYDDSNPNPQISVVFDREVVTSPTGYTGIDPGGGGPTAWPEGIVHVDVWVPGDRDLTGGENPKKHTWQLRKEVERIIGLNHDGTTDANGNRELHSLGTGNIRRLADPEETPVEHWTRIPVTYTYFKGRE